MQSMAFKTMGLALLLAGMAGLSLASAVPEIDASTASNALALLGGAALIIRARKR